MYEPPAVAAVTLVGDVLVGNEVGSQLINPAWAEEQSAEQER